MPFGSNKKGRKGEFTMRRKNLSILFAVASTLLISGCEKQNTENTPETVLDMSASSEAPIDVDILSETVEGASAETLTTPESEQTATTEVTPQDATSAVLKSDNATPAATVNATKAFQPNDGWTSNFSFQMPGNWSYTIDEDTTEWGFFIQVNNLENASVHIYGQYGTLNVAGFYTGTPTEFETSSGMKGKFYQEKRTGEDGSSYVEGDIVFDTNSYSAHFYMPESIYNEYKDTLRAIFLSIKIEDVFAE